MKGARCRSGGTRAKPGNPPATKHANAHRNPKRQAQVPPERQAPPTTPLGRAVVCTPPVPRCIAPGGLSVVLLPPDALGHLTHHPSSQCPQQLGMVVSEVPLSR